MKRIGVDAGGTFTDAVLWDAEQGLLSSAKASSRRADPAAAVRDAAARVLDAAPGGTDDLRDLVHGTTIGTNVCLERNGPRIALLTTDGFRDVLEIGRLMRPPDHLYDLLAPGPAPLVARRDRFEVAERVDCDGKVLTELDEDTVAAAAEVITARGISSVAVSYLYSYLNPEHERRTEELLRRHAPGLAVSLSSDVLPQVREFERTSTTALNAYLVPVTAPYLARLRAEVDGWRPGLRTWIMQSNGGVTSAERAARTPVNLLLSGPSGGAVAGRLIARQTGLANTITVDMGGTSFDVCLLSDQTIPLAHERSVMEMPVQVPTVDIATIGTGGGSIASVDPGGQFLVGPASAGASPGPAAYGRGGTEPTVTDANLVLGILQDGQVLGGEVTLDLAAAERACARLGRGLGLSTVETALGIRRISTAAMAGAVRAVTVGRGHDPRDFALNAFGGAGPMHAADIAAELAIPTVVVPPVAGCLSAVGLVVSDVLHDYAASLLAPLSHDIETQVARLFANLAGTATEELTDEGVAPANQTVRFGLDLRYAGQNSSVTVPVAAEITPGWLARVAADFHAAHERANGFRVPDEPIDVVTARVTGVGTLTGDGPPPRPVTARPAPLAGGSRRLIVDGADGGDAVDVPRYRRDTLLPGCELTGPSVVESADTTLVVPPKARARVDGHGNLLLDLGGHR